MFLRGLPLLIRFIWNIWGACRLYSNKQRGTFVVWVRVHRNSILVSSAGVGHHLKALCVTFVRSTSYICILDQAGTARTGYCVSYRGRTRALNEKLTAPPTINMLVSINRINRSSISHQQRDQQVYKKISNNRTLPYFLLPRCAVFSPAFACGSPNRFPLSM